MIWCLRTPKKKTLRGIIKTDLFSEKKKTVLMTEFMFGSGVSVGVRLKGVGIDDAVVKKLNCSVSLGFFDQGWCRRLI